MKVFDKKSLKKLYKSPKDSSGEENGQVTFIGGSELFHGPPVFILKTISRIVDMVFFASPYVPNRDVAANLKSHVGSFIWVPWGEVGKYIEKSDACLIGPGFMRFSSEKTPHGERYHKCDTACKKSRTITKRILTKYPKKRWVIDAGSLQVMDHEWIPENAILTPNIKEFGYLFPNMSPREAAGAHKCTIVVKGPSTNVCGPKTCVEVKGGNPGLTKGGTGDVQAGLTVALMAKNEAFLAASAAAYIVKAAADYLEKSVGTYYNADDLADAVPLVMGNI